MVLKTGCAANRRMIVVVRQDQDDCPYADNAPYAADISSALVGEISNNVPAHPEIT